ncbi:helix-turn-helix domain-containing protein [Niabella hibiscisoli]|uniref:helix-turn-helix domain-containing protein n=1 Tax=Niabella hibiscisoli TaxID=1825928 RepID=UPI001F0EF812|nr:helix-turn-helix domain-containing protein [Niabella hibiscisoli]MCH5717948.1 helix-turn-helix domain-containing protein [Niabella hibiscisoli]
MTIQNIKQLLSINPNRKIYRSDNPIVYEQNIYYREYQELNNRQSDAVFMQTQGILLQLLSQFLALVDFKKGSSSKIPSVILDAIRFIQINLSADIKVTYLAKRANLQADYFSRIFLKHSGERPLQYIQARRIERAQYLIVTTDLPFSKIAEVTGFQDIHYFFKVFKKQTQMTPREYALKNHFV